MQIPFLFLGMGPQEIMVLAVLGIILFGRRLPEVGRSLGKSFVQFKAGLEDMKSEMTEMNRMTDEAARHSKRRAPRDAEARTVVDDAEDRREPEPESESEDGPATDQDSKSPDASQ
ncbi:MAG: twin-arginine translocase TatA/TatE family subunit [Planctomycetes bacterium]|nr:twin-arginine translocase TatA/TatE family subunit [Planctomycetota bacterium]